MNILLLSNSAPNYHHFFNQLALKFRDTGSKVVIAVDSNFSRDLNKLDTLGLEIYEFSNYFSAHHTNNSLLEKYSDYNLNAALLSDFERAEVLGIWGEKGNDYFEKLKSALLGYFEDIFNDHKIDAVVYENVSNTFSHFALFVAQKYGVRYCGIGSSRLPGRFSITSDPLMDTEPAEIFNAIRSGKRYVEPEVRAWCEEYLKNIESVIPDYMRSNGLDNTDLFKRYARWDRIKTIYLILRHALDDAHHSFQIGNPVKHFFNSFMRNVARRIKVQRLHSYYDTPIESEKFLLYPLHFHPESSTSILSGTYLNEYEVIRNLAFNLPQGVKLYVKDHISAHGFPSINFYKKLKFLPNVRVISPYANTKLLIKKSIAVITLTSTVGYEALLMGKKVFLFGNVFYEFHKNVKKIENPSAIFDLLRDLRPDEFSHDHSYNIDFVSAYYLATKSGKLNLMLDQDEAKRMADAVFPMIYDYCRGY